MALKHHINRYSGFIKMAGGGVVLPPSLRNTTYTKNNLFYREHNKKLLEGKGVAHHKEMGGTVLHNHKHSTKEIMEHKKTRHIQPIKFNF